jgi:hypothetical protein
MKYRNRIPEPGTTLVRTKSFFVKHANFITHDASFEVMILLFYYWLGPKKIYVCLLLHVKELKVIILQLPSVTI